MNSTVPVQVGKSARRAHKHAPEHKLEPELAHKHAPEHKLEPEQEHKHAPEHKHGPEHRLGQERRRVLGLHSEQLGRKTVSKRKGLSSSVLHQHRMGYCNPLKHNDLT